MELKLSEILSLREPLNELSGVPMSATAAFRVQGTLAAVELELEKIESTRSKLAKRVCEESDCPEASTVPSDKMDYFREQIGELLEETVKLSVRSINLDAITGDIRPGALRALVQHGIVIGPKE